MDRNLIFAFALTLGAFLFFNSDFYNYTLLDKERPKPVSRLERAPTRFDSLEADVSSKRSSVNVASDSASAIPSPLTTALSPSTADTLEGRSILVIGRVFKAAFNERGALATSWKMTGVTGREGEEVELIPEKSAGLFNLTINDLNLDRLPFVFKGPDTVFLNSRDSLVFTCNLGNGAVVRKGFVLDPDSFAAEVFFIADSMKASSYRFGWKGGVVETEKDYSGQYADDAISIFFGDDVDHPVDNDDTAKDVEGTIRWVSLRSKYFSGTFIPEKADDYLVSVKKLSRTQASRNDLNFAFEINGRVESPITRYQVIFCPNKYSILTGYDIKLEKILFKGYRWFFFADLWFPKLCGLILLVLNFFYGLFPNYGVAIIFLTIVSKIVTLPLTLKSSRSMARMKLFQPRIDAIRAKFKGDPMATQKAIMKLYKDEGISPLNAGGCLPMILQMPIFIALFVALRKAIELRGAPFMLWITDLSGPEAMFMLPSKILFYGPNVSLLTVLMSVTMFIQSKQTMAGTDPNQKIMLYMMPVVMLFILNSMPSGLTLYWTLSNILGIVQNKMIKIKPEDLANEKAKPKKSFLKKMSYNDILKRMGRK